METVVALLRNGLCVCADTFSESHWLKLPLKAFAELFKTESSPPSEALRRVKWYLSKGGEGLLGEVSTLSLGISFFQLCAVIFNVVGAWKGLPRSFAALRRARRARTKADKSKSRALEAGATRLVLRAQSDLAYSLVRLMLAPSFFVLATFTVKLTTQYFLEYALLLMQVALGVALWAMWRDLGSRRRKADCADQLSSATTKTPTSADDDDRALAFVDFVDVPEFPPFSPGQETSLVAVVEGSLEADAGEKCDQWVAAAKRFAASNPDAVKRLARAERRLALVDLLVWVLNFIAFLGYLVFPMTYFGPFERDPNLEWLGNFAGDLAWTIEPALLLVAACGIFNSSVSTKDKTKTD